MNGAIDPNSNGDTMKLRRTLPAALAIAAALSTVLVAAPAQAFAGGPIINSGVFGADLRLCLTPNGFDEGAVVTQEQCNGLTGQAWTPVLLDTGSHFNFVSAGTGKCLDVQGGRALDHSTIVVRSCNGASGQRWSLQGTPNGAAAELRSGVAGTNSHCLDLPGNTHTPHAAMQLFTCNNTVAQRWLF
jgi:hypothetical protein